MHSKTSWLTWTLVAAGALLALAIVLVLRFEREPLWRDKPISYWLEQPISESDLLEMGAELGPRLFPALKEAIEVQEDASDDPAPRAKSRARDRAVFLAQNWGPEADPLTASLLKLHQSGVPADLKARALHAAATVSPRNEKVKQAVLSALLAGGRSRSEAAAIIKSAGLRDEDFIGPLAKAVEATGPESAASEFPAAELLALSTQRPLADPLIPALERAWSFRELKGVVLASLLELGPHAQPCTGFLGETLRDEANRVFWPEILHILARIGPAAEVASSDVGRLVEHRDPVIREMAAFAAARIRSRPEFAVSLFIQLLNDTNYSNARAVMPLRLTENLGLGHREAAAWFLGELGPSAASASAALKDCLQTREQRLALFCARAMYKITGETRELMPVLRRALNSRNPSSVMIAAHIVMEMGQAGQGLASDLETAMRSDLKSRRAAREALLGLGTNPD